MKSAIAISYELDDIETIARELTEQVKRKLTFEKNTVAILYGQPDMEIDELSYALNLELGCHVLGGTTAAGATLTNEGYHELAVVLHVLTDSECIFSAAISDSMSIDPIDEVTDTFREAYNNLKKQDSAAEPKMAICVASIAGGIASDDILGKISELCGSIPVFGFNAADDFDFSKQQVYLDGITGSNRLAILLISSNIFPIFQLYFARKKMKSLLWIDPCS